MMALQAGKRRNLTRVCLGVVLLAGLTLGAKMVGPKGEFTSATVDVGIVVSDVDVAAAFYKDALGFTEVQGFDVPASMGGDSGLTNHKAFHVRVMVLDDTENTTKIKLMEFPDVPSKKADNTFIHSTLGLSYLTIHVTDMTAAVERAKKAGAQPLAKGPTLIPRQLPRRVYLTLVRDPDGNMIELVGPGK